MENKNIRALAYLKLSEFFLRRSYKKGVYLQKIKNMKYLIEQQNSLVKINEAKYRKSSKWAAKQYGIGKVVK